MNYVLVHGAWHGGWCWEQVARRLRAAGATVSTPDLPGHEAAASARSSVDMDAYVEHIVAVITAQHEPVELVGHSMGGMVISAVAERIPERVRGLTYVSAFVPRSGDSLSRLGAEDADTDLNDAIRPGTQSGTLVIDAAAGREVFYHDCQDADADAALARLVPQAITPLTNPVTLTAERFGAQPRAYVHCTLDRAVSPAMQAMLRERTPCDPVLELATGHSPFLADPDALAAALMRIAEQR